jgi:hypothetical protein
LEGKRFTFGVIMGGWPIWIMGAQSQGWDVKVVIVKSNPWSLVIPIWSPTSTLFKYAKCDKGLNLKVDAWLSDIDPLRN